MKKRKEVVPTGGYIETDESGLLINPTSIVNVKGKWLKLVDELVDCYKTAFGGNLHSVYLRGSVPRGFVVEGVSDLDSFCVVNTYSTEELSELENLVVNLNLKYPFTNNIECYPITLEDVMSRESDKFLIKVQSLCIWGEGLAMRLPECSLGINAFNHCLKLKELNRNFYEYSAEADKLNDLERFCYNWATRVLLRSAFEVVMLREQRFTRDLYYCWSSYTKYYPKSEAALYQVLEYAINPISELAEITEMWEEIMPGLVSQVDNGEHLLMR